MAKTVVGLYDNFAEAQRVVEDLVEFGIPREDISIAASDTKGEYKAYLDSHKGEDMGGAAEGAGVGAAIGGIGGLLLGLGVLAIPGVGPLLAAGPLATALVGAGVGAAAGGMIGALVDLGVPEEEAEYYAEGVRRGGALVTVYTSDEMADDAAAIMNRYNAIDVHERASGWRESGWTGFNYETEGKIDTATTAATMASTTMDTSHSTTARRRDARMEDQGEMHVPIVEEEIQIGKREVQQGGARVHTRVVEQPVEETVSLRRERVNVERRPVDRPLTDADMDAFQEGTIEVTATSEEPIVRKQARVTEEVVISKDVAQETETVRDTVRRTDVQVEHDRGMASTGGSSFDTYRSAFRKHYDSAFATSGRAFDAYIPAYRYGYDIANNEQYRGRNWRDIEADIRHDWETRYPNDTWSDFKAAVRRGWDTVTGRR